VKNDYFIHLWKM